MSYNYDIEELTTEGLDRIGEIIRGESSDYISKMQIGSSAETQVNPYYANEGVTGIVNPYTDGGFEAKTATGLYNESDTALHISASFTNTSSETRDIREVGLLFHADDACAYRQVVSGAACTIRPGESVIIDVAIPFEQNSAHGSSPRSYYDTYPRIVTSHMFNSTFVTTITRVSAGRAIPTAAYERLAKIAIGNVSDTVTQMQLGSGTSEESLLSTGLVTAYTDGGFEMGAATVTYANYTMTWTKTFTNTSTSEREVREIGLFFDSDDALFLRKLIRSVHDIPNLCIVPPGETITVEVSVSFAGVSSYYGTLGEINCFDGTNDNFASVLVELADPEVSITLDPSDFDTPYDLCYNGVEIPNGNISAITSPAGGLSFDISGVTEDIGDIEKLRRYAGKVNVGTSVSGKQFCTSAYRQGTLAVKKSTSINNYANADHDETTSTHYLFKRCYIDGDVSVEPYNKGWLFDMRVVQSAYEEVV